MKILVIQDYLRSGGTERQSIFLTRAFREAGHDAALLTFRPGGTLAGSASDLPRIVLQPFDLHFDWFAPGLHKNVCQFAPDVILCMGRMANCHAGSVQRMMSAKLPRSVLVCTMRTGKLLPSMFVDSLHLAHQVVANSEVSKKVLIENYALSPERISVIHNSLVFEPNNDPAIVADDRAKLRARFGVSENTRVLLSVAMFRPEKNQRELIELAAQLPRDRDWQLWLAGEGTALAECQALVSSLNLGDRVKFTGFQTDPRPLYHAADIGVLTSKSESLSNFLVEAHAHGLPSVAYEISGVAECGGIIVPAGDQRAFLDALKRLLEDDAHRAELSAQVRAYATAHFMPKRQAEKYLSLFEQLLTTAQTEQ